MILVGSEFQYFGAETENGLTYKEVRDLGTANDDLSVRYVQYGILKLIPFKDVNKHDYCKRNVYCRRPGPCRLLN